MSLTCLLFREVPGSRVLKEMGSLPLKNQRREDIQRGHRAEEVRRIPGFMLISG